VPENPKSGRPDSKSPEVISTDVLSRSDSGKWASRTDVLVREEPLEIRVRGRSVAVTMRTPGHDKELAAGFLLTEGIVRKAADILEVAPCLESDAPENTLNVFLSAAVEVDFEQLTRHVFASSSCGLCGKASIDTVHQHFPPTESRVQVTVETLAQMPERLRAAQQTFAQTGGLHAAAVFDCRGELLVLREDVGRHNAVDKVIGHGLLGGLLPFDSHVLLVSGRASFEIMQKALAARIAIVSAISAPSSLAVEFARDSGQTMVGFLRGQRMNVYSRPERIAGASEGHVR
jgi:FdhD protein